MDDWVAALSAAVERTYGSPARLAFTTTVMAGTERRVVLGFDVHLHGHSSLCFAWNEPTAHEHPCIVLRTDEFHTAADAVKAVVGDAPSPRQPAGVRFRGRTGVG